MRSRHICILWLVLVMGFAAVAGMARAPGPADPGAWGEKYATQYESYKKNYMEIPQTFGGSVASSKLDKYPEARAIYAGMGFSLEFNASRGHVYSLLDVMDTVRPKAGGVCLTCKSADVPRLISELGEDAFYKADFEAVASRAVHPVSCANCHDARDMSLIITNPALERGLAAAGGSDDMRLLACAQCHVEYYFTKESLRLTLPWDKGISPHAIEEYYDSIGFSDWAHTVSGIGLIKIQHPEYETFTDSIHHRMGLACADCHMPEMGSGQETHSSHWWTSPLNHIHESCTHCHGPSVEEIRARVHEIQEETSHRLRSIGETLVGLHALAGARRQSMRPEDMEIVADSIRRAQFRWDWVFSENSTGFHNAAMLAGLLDEAEEYLARAGEKLK